MDLFPPTRALPSASSRAPAPAPVAAPARAAAPVAGPAPRAAPTQTQNQRVLAQQLRDNMTELRRAQQELAARVNQNLQGGAVPRNNAVAVAPAPPAYPAVAAVPPVARVPAPGPAPWILASEVPDTHIPADYRAYALALQDSPNTPPMALALRGVTPVLQHVFTQFNFAPAEGITAYMGDLHLHFGWLVPQKWRLIPQQEIEFAVQVRSYVLFF